MKLNLEINKKEKTISAIIAAVILFIVYWYNKRYLYVIDAEFTNGEPSAIILKTGFIFPVKKHIELKDGESSKIRLYGYTYLIKKTTTGFDLFLNGKKIHSIYTDAYYTETKKLPTGRIYL